MKIVIFSKAWDKKWSKNESKFIESLMMYQDFKILRPHFDRFMRLNDDFCGIRKNLISTLCFSHQGRAKNRPFLTIFFHFHDQKSKNVQFEHNLPYTEHYDSVFSGVFICIMDMYRHHFVSGNQIHWFCGKKQKDLNFVLIFPT